MPSGDFSPDTGINQVLILPECVYQDSVGDFGGWQDQYAAAFGGFRKIVFGKDGVVCVEGAMVYPSYSGTKVIPGDYQAHISVGDAEETVSFKLLADPRDNASKEEYEFLEDKLAEGTEACHL